MKELTKIEELQKENAKLNERLNNCARQFKKMMQTIDELQHKVSELEAKMNQTSTNETSTKQYKSDSKPSNPSNLTTIKEEEEKPTESNSEPSMAIVEDADADFEYGLFTSAVEACTAANAYYDSITLLTYKKMILDNIDLKNASYRVRKEVEDRIDKFIQDFNEKSDSKPSNEYSDIVANPKQNNATESVSTASTAISEDNATASYDVDDLFDGIIISGKASKKDELKQSNKGTDCTPVQSEYTKKDDSKEDSNEVKDLKMPKTVEGCFQRYLESVEDITNPTKADLNWRKDCITQSCKIEGFDESFIQKLKSKIDEYNKEHSEKRDSNPSNGSTLTTTHQEEEKPTEAQQTPLNEEKLRYLDTATNKQYATEEEAQKDGVNPWFLYDWKVGRCITKYTSPSSHSNASTLTHLSINDEKCLRFAFKQP